MAPPLPSTSASNSTSSYMQHQQMSSNGSGRTLSALNTMLNDTDPNQNPTFGGYSLHSHVPPLPSPDTTAAAAALFRVNQMPSSHILLSPTEPSYESKFTIQRYEQQEEERGYITSYKGKRQRSSSSSLSFASYDPQYERERKTVIPLEPIAIPPSNTVITPMESASIAISRTVSAPSSLPSLTFDSSNSNANNCNANANNSNLNSNAKRNVGIPKFLRFLFQMLEQEDGTIIAWSHQGTAFQIKQPDLLSQLILPKYFKHNKISSFQRQLNYFGFKKWTKTQTTICTFSHPSFRRDDREKMLMIKRNERVKGEELLVHEPEEEKEIKEEMKHKKRMRQVQTLVIPLREENKGMNETISSESIARMLRPTISPSSTAASASMVSLATSMPSSNGTFGRLLEPHHSYSEGSSEVLGYPSQRTRRPSVFDMNPSSQWTSTPPPTTTLNDPYDPSSSSYDTDPMGMLMNGSIPLERSPPPPSSSSASSSTDYLDVLLESATMEESHVSSSSSSDATVPTSWEAACEPHPLHPPRQQQQMLTTPSTFPYQAQTSRRYE